MEQRSDIKISKGDLISRSALESVIQRKSGAMMHKEDVVAIIANAHAVDAVEVVRCKDCKHLNGEYWCTNWRGLYDYTKDDDFCSYGERKDGE